MPTFPNRFPQFATTLFLGALPLFGAPPVTFSEHIAPILNERCASCHRPGEAAPFSLLTYEDAAKRASLIAAVTKRRYMPPWKAEPASFPYRDSRRLSDTELSTIAEWVRQGMPKGDLTKAPAPPKFEPGWQLGTPDLIVEMPEAFPIPAEGPDLYRNFVIPLNLSEDRWLQGIELRPSARKTVHHVLFFADTSGEARKRAEHGQDGTAMRLTAGTLPLGGWAVGAQPHLLPGGLANALPKSSDLVLQYHFHPTGKAESERTVVGLYFAKKAPSRTVTSILMPPAFGLFSGIDIPANDRTFTVKDSFVMPVDVEAVSVGAHAHYLGKVMKMTATLPDGSVKTLLDIKDWDFSWQDRYFFQDFIPLPKGTRLDSEVSWDNSEQNPRNPSRSPVRITWGEESKDEMGAIGLQVVPKVEADFSVLRKELRAHQRALAIAGIQKNPALLVKIRQLTGGSVQ